MADCGGPVTPRTYLGRLVGSTLLLPPSHHTCPCFPHAPFIVKPGPCHLRNVTCKSPPRRPPTHCKGFALFIGCTLFTGCQVILAPRVTSLAPCRHLSPTHSCCACPPFSPALGGHALPPTPPPPPPQASPLCACRSTTAVWMAVTAAPARAPVAPAHLPWVPRQAVPEALPPQAQLPSPHSHCPLPHPSATAAAWRVSGACKGSRTQGLGRVVAQVGAGATRCTVTVRRRQR